MAVNKDQPIPVEIEKVLDELEAADKLDPEHLVARAETDETLHGLFEWDDAIAGHHHRLEQARRLIRRVKIVQPRDEKNGEIRVRKYVHVDSIGRYQTVKRAMSGPHAEEVIERARRDLAAWQRRYSHLADWRKVVDEMLTQTDN